MCRAPFKPAYAELDILAKINVFIHPFSTNVLPFNRR